MSPTITDPNLVVVEPSSPPDSLGRRRFVAYWLADNIGPSCDQTGTRGQGFRCDLDAWTARHVASGSRVVFLADYLGLLDGAK